mmetsp:Transcript_18461/g.31834  ORF Transcript_18461/g.31834 Transcript_18461/m.31834 type:complete len:324 (+) Transcript_18461:180-1151(+)
MRQCLSISMSAVSVAFGVLSFFLYGFQSYVIQIRLTESEGVPTDFRLRYDSGNITKLLCRRFKTPKVAACVSGRLGSFYHPLVYTSIKHHLFDAFAAEIDVFLYLKMPSATGDTPEHLDWKVQFPHALKYLRPVAVTLETNSTSLDVNELCHLFSEDGGRLPRNEEEDWLEQYADMAKCYSMITQSESSTGILYDWIIRVRPDFVFYGPSYPFCAFGQDNMYYDQYERPQDFSLIPRKFSAALYERVLADYQACRGLRVVTSLDENLAVALSSMNVTSDAKDFRLIPFGALARSRNVCKSQHSLTRPSRIRISKDSCEAMVFE